MSSEAASVTPAQISTRREIRPFSLLKLNDHLLMCVIDKVVECDIEDGIENGVWRPKPKYFSARTLLPLDIDDGVPEAPRPIRALMSLSQVNKRLRHLAKPRIFRTIRLLRWNYGDGFYCFSRDAFQRNAAVVGRLPARLPTQILDLFAAPPVWLFKATQSLAIHQFWQGSAGWIAEGIRAILEAPNSLRRLHLDGDAEFADDLARAMTRHPVVKLEDLTEIIVSLEMSFILNYAPNVKRVSNKAFSGCITAPRPKSLQMVQEFYRLCQSLPKLRTMEISVANFEAPFRINLPLLSLTSLRLSNEELRSHSSPGEWVNEDGEDEDFDVCYRRVPMSFLVKMIRAQPGLVEARIPRPEKIDALDDKRGQWDWKGGLTDMLSAAIIATLVPTIRRVLVGRSSIVDIVRRDGEQTVLRLSGDSSTADQGERRFLDNPHPNWFGKPCWGPVPETCWHSLWDDWKEPILTMQHRRNEDILVAMLPFSITHGESDKPAATFIVDEEGQPTSVEVNLCNPHLEWLLVD